MSMRGCFGGHIGHDTGLTGLSVTMREKRINCQKENKLYESATNQTNPGFEIGNE